MIRRWRDELDGTWHESGDLDQWDVEQDARAVLGAELRVKAQPRRLPKPRRNPRRLTES